MRRLSVMDAVRIMGPAFLVSVALVDPGNWATAIEAGSKFGYELVWVVVASNLIAILLQTLAARLGIVSGKHLAQVCRESYPPQICTLLWVLCEISIVALDLTMLLGTAIGLNLLLGWPLLPCILLTSLDALLLLLLVPAQGVRKSEALTVGLLAVVVACFLVDLLVSRPPLRSVVSGLLPRLRRDSVYTAVSLLGANVMPHNFYLHSALVSGQAAKAATAAGRGRAAGAGAGGDGGGLQGHIRTLCLYNFLDIGAALGVALVINVALLLVSAATFHSAGVVVHTLQAAHDLMEQTLSSSIAPAAFGTALLCAGQLSTFTGTIAGQVVLQGFLNIHISTWLRRLITRTAAIIPAAVLQYVYGDRGTYKFLLIAQVVLALQLPVTLVPLIKATSNRQLMGCHASSRLMSAAAWGATGLVFLANLMLFVTQMLPEVSSGRGILDKDGSLDAWIDRMASLAYSDPLRAMGLVGLLVAASAFLALQLWMIVTPLRVDASALTTLSTASFLHDDDCTILPTGELSSTLSGGGGSSSVAAAAPAGLGLNCVGVEQRAVAAASRGISRWWYDGGAGLPHSYEGSAGCCWFGLWGSGWGSQQSRQQLAVQVYGRGKSYISAVPVQQAAGQQAPAWPQQQLPPQWVCSLGASGAAPDVMGPASLSAFTTAADAAAAASTTVDDGGWIIPRSVVATVIGSGLRPYDASTALDDLALLPLPWRPRERYYRRRSGCFYSEADSDGCITAQDVSDTDDEVKDEDGMSNHAGGLASSPTRHMLGSAVEEAHDSRNVVEEVASRNQAVDQIVAVIEVQCQGSAASEISPAFHATLANRCSGSSGSTTTMMSSTPAATAAAAITAIATTGSDLEIGRERRRRRLPSGLADSTVAAAAPASTAGVSHAAGTSTCIGADAGFCANAERASSVTSAPPTHVVMAPRAGACIAATVDKGSSGGGGGILQRPKHPVARGTRPKFAKILEDFWASFYDAHGRPVGRARDMPARLRPQQVWRHERAKGSVGYGAGGAGAGSAGGQDHAGFPSAAAGDCSRINGSWAGGGAATAAVATGAVTAAITDPPLWSPLLCSHTDGSHLCMGCSQALFEAVRQCLRTLEQLEEVSEAVWGSWPLQLLMPSDNQTFHYHRAILLAARNADFIALQALCAGTYSSLVDQSRLLSSTPLLGQTADRLMSNPLTAVAVAMSPEPAAALPPAGCHVHNMRASSNFFQPQQQQQAQDGKEQQVMQQPLAQPWSWWTGQGRAGCTTTTTSCHSFGIDSGGASLSFPAAGSGSGGGGARCSGGGTAAVLASLPQQQQLPLSPHPHPSTIQYSAATPTVASLSSHGPLLDVATATSTVLRTSSSTSSSCSSSALASWGQVEASSCFSRHHLDTDGSARPASTSEATTAVRGWSRKVFGAASPAALPVPLPSSSSSPRDHGTPSSEPLPPRPPAPPPALTHPKAPLQPPARQEQPSPLLRHVQPGLVAPPTFSSWCVFGPAVLVSFGVWSVFTLAQWCMADSRPAHWGHYASVLNRLQGVLRDARLELTTMVAAATVALQEVAGEVAGGGGYTSPALLLLASARSLPPQQHQYMQMFPAATAAEPSLQQEQQHQHQQLNRGRLGAGQRGNARAGTQPPLQQATRQQELPQQQLLPAQQQQHLQQWQPQVADLLPPTALRLCPEHLELLRKELLQQLEGMEVYVLGRRGPAETAAGQVAFPKAKEIMASVMRRYRRRLGTGAGVGTSTTAASEISPQATDGGGRVVHANVQQAATAVRTVALASRQQHTAGDAAGAVGFTSQYNSTVTCGPRWQPLGPCAGSGTRPAAMTISTATSSTGRGAVLRPAVFQRFR